MLQTLHSETNFLETNFLNKLIQHTFQFIICKNIPHRVLDYQQKRYFPLTKASKIFVLNFVTDTTKKFNLQFLVFTWHFFLVNWQFRQKSFNNNKKNKAALYSLLIDLELKVKTSCYGHYTILVRILQCGTFFYTGKNKGVFLFISKLLIIDFIRTDKFILIRPNYKLILFSGCADIHNIKTTLGCTCNFGMWSIPLRACSLQFSFIEHVL